MPGIEPTIKVTCIVDDAVQRNSPIWGEHGLALLVEAGGGRLLFDTGQSGTVLLHNLDLLNIDPATIDALAISHAHYDHTGGLPALLQPGGVRPGTPLYASPDLFRQRFSQKEGQAKNIGLRLARKDLERGLVLRLSAEPQEILPGLWTTGEISERPEVEGKSGSHLMRESQDLVADAYRDDMALVLEQGDRLALICGCCHAGLLNTVAHVQRRFQRQVVAIVGGLHLTGLSAGDMQHTAQVLAAMPGLERVCPNHCSGEAAYVALTQLLGPSVVRPCPAGTVLEW